MATNRLCQRLRNGETCLGLGNMYPAAGIVEGMCRGWDFVWIDGQHGQMAYDACLGAVQAAAGLGLDTVLRVPGHEPGIVGPLLDLAPSALMAPMVNNAEDARRVVEATHFPPLGTRSYGGRRVIDLYGREYYLERETLVIAQIETLEAVDCAREIIGTDGIDMLFFGPDDAKVRMKIPIHTGIQEHETLREAMKRTADAALAAGKLCGTVAANAAALHTARALGYTCLVGGGDIMFLRTGSAAKLEELRGAMQVQERGPAEAAPGGGVYGG